MIKEANAITSPYVTLTTEQKLQMYDNTKGEDYRKLFLQQYPELLPIIQQRNSPGAVKQTIMQQITNPQLQQPIPSPLLNNFNRVQQPITTTPMKQQKPQQPFPTTPQSHMMMQQKLQQPLPTTPQSQLMQPQSHPQITPFGNVQQAKYQFFQTVVNLNQKDKLNLFLTSNNETKRELLSLPFFADYFGKKKAQYEKSNELGKEKMLKHEIVFLDYVNFYDSSIVNGNPQQWKLYTELLQKVLQKDPVGISDTLSQITTNTLDIIFFGTLHIQPLLDTVLTTQDSKILDTVLSGLAQKDSTFPARMLNKRNFNGTPPLIECIERHWMEGAQLCLKYGSRIYERELTMNYHSIHVAMQSQMEIEFLNLLLNSGQYVSETSIDQSIGYSLIEFAMLTGKPELVKTMFVSLSHYHFFLGKRIFTIAQKSTISVWQTVLTFVPNFVDDDGYGPGHILAISSNQNSLKLLKILHGKHPDKLHTLSNNHFTPLMLAMRYQKIEFIKFLLDAGADLKVKEKKNGINALMILFMYMPMVSF